MIVALGQDVSEQLAAKLRNVVDQAVDAQRQVFGRAKHGVDLGLFGDQRLPLAADDVRFGRLALGWRRPELVDPGVDVGDPRPKGEAALQQLPRDVFELQPDVDER